MTSEGSNVRAACYVGERTLTSSRTSRAIPVTARSRSTSPTPGICGTDLHILHGAMDARVTLPAVLGHEMSGTIAAIGNGVSGRSVGERVTVMPLAPCGDCPACRAGYSHICHNLDFLGIDSPGSMQSSWNVSQDVLVGLPAALSLEHAALAEPTAVAVHDVRRAQLREGERALVVGGGPIGLLVACAARARGADVVVVEPAERRRELAQAVGLRAVDPTAVDVQAFVSDWTDGAGAEVAFEVSGAVAGIETAIQSLGGARTHRRRRDPRNGTGGESLPCVLARADADRRARLRAA